jgi:ATP-binding cassette subfamily B protein
VALFRPYRGRVAVIAATILVSSLLGISLPFLTQAIFDRALFPRVAGVVGQPDIGLLVALVAISVVVTLLGALLGVGQTYLTTRLGNAVMRDLRDRLFSHLQRMELAFFTRTRTGEIQSRLGNDVAGCSRSSRTPPARSSATSSRCCRRWSRWWCCPGG